MYGPLHSLYALVLLGYTLTCIAIPVYRLRNTSDSLERAQLKMVLLGFSTTGIGAATLQLVFPIMFGTRPFPGVAPSLTSVLAAFIAYSILKHRLLETTLVVRSASIFVLTTTVLAVLFYVLATSELMPFPSNNPAQNALRALLAASIGAAITPFTRQIVTQFLDKYVFISHYNYQRELIEFSRQIAMHHELDKLTQFIISGLKNLMNSTACNVYLVDKILYAESYLPDAVRQSCLFFFGLLKKAPKILVDYEVKGAVSAQQFCEYRTAFSHLKASVVIPLTTRHGLIGIITLGQKRAGGIYTEQDINFLTTLSNQAAIAIHNAALYTELLEVKNYLETIVHQMTCGLIVVDSSGTVLRVNKNGACFLDRPIQVLEGSSITNLPGELQQVFQTTLRQKKIIENQEVYFPQASGIPRILSVSSVPLNDGADHVIGALGVLTDMTELRLLETELRKAERLATVGTLAAGLAHEIKNPLVSLKTFAELLPTKYDDSDFRESFSQIAIAEIDRINSLVEQLLRFARPPKPSPIPIDVHEPLEQTLSLLASEFSRSQVVVKRNFHPSPLIVNGDSEQLKQVFMNVLLNALEALSPKGGGLIEVSTSMRKRWNWAAAGLPPEPPSGYLLTDLEAVVRVSDNGPGIRESHLKHVFDPFFTTKDTGHGLGLSIAHGIVREHRGTINAENKPGGGALFTIALPLLEKEARVQDGKHDELRAGNIA